MGHTPGKFVHQMEDNIATVMRDLRFPQHLPVQDLKGECGLCRENSICLCQPNQSSKDYQMTFYRQCGSKLSESESTNKTDIKTRPLDYIASFDSSPLELVRSFVSWRLIPESFGKMELTSIHPERLLTLIFRCLVLVTKQTPDMDLVLLVHRLLADTENRLHQVVEELREFVGPLTIELATILWKFLIFETLKSRSLQWNHAATFGQELIAAATSSCQLITPVTISNPLASPRHIIYD